ncbi:MAG: AAA family ATPase [Miltoncostaeaceae bacterium]
MTTTPPRILERERESAALEACLDAALAGDGAVAVVEGAPGIGKTALAAVVRHRATGRSFPVLRAAGAELDAEFPFGVVIQLLAPALAVADDPRRARLLGGAAAQAEGVLEARTGAPAGPDAMHAALHGLYWFTANLAEDGPLVLVVDDLHWCDTASLRFLEFLGRRLDGLPALVVGTTRPGTEGERGRLIGALADGPSAVVVRPGALSPAATGEMLARSLGTRPTAGFAAAAHRVTGGTPLLVSDIGRAAADRGLAGTDDEAGAVEALGDEDLAARIGRRLEGLGAEATSVARAVAVLGERAGLREVAALAGLTETEAADALDRLAAAQILDGERRAFVHPLVREATRSGTPPARRASLHAAAARLVAGRARPGEVAVHLLQAEPAGDAWAVSALREAARIAAGEGAIEAAIAHLRRAVEEPPPADEAADLLVDLAELEVAAGAPGAADRVAAALAAGARGDAEARVRAARARVSLLQDPSAAMADLEAAMAVVTSAPLERRLRSGLLTAIVYDGALADRGTGAGWAGDGAAPPTGEAAVAMAHRAIDAAYRGSPAHEVAAAAQRALAGEALLGEVGLLSGSYHLLVLALRLSELPDLALAALEAGDIERRRTSSRLGALYMDHGRAYWAWSFGSLTAAEGHARAALAAADETGLALARTSLETLLAEILLARGATEEAAALAEGLAITPVVERTIAGSDALAARGWTRRATGRTDEAEADLRRARDLVLARGWRAPHKARATLRLAHLLAGRPDGRDEALALAGESLAAAEAAGLAGAAGIARRVRGLALGAHEGLDELAGATAALAESPLAMDHAWALCDLGAAQRRLGRRRESRETLRRALDAGLRLGAGRLAGVARDELAASGARLRTEALAGVAALTPGELRVVELAARGMTNRQIAESLWVTRKTVEVHLGRSYGKLGIRSRGELAAALAPAGPDAP